MNLDFLKNAKILSRNELKIFSAGFGIKTRCEGLSGPTACPHPCILYWEDEETKNGGAGCSDCCVIVKSISEF